MPSAQVVSLAVSVIIELIVLVGLVARRRFSRCLGFFAYLASVLITTLMVVVRPDLFFVFQFWRTMNVLYAALRHVTALELAFHTFRAFPAARRLARSFLWLMSVLALAAPFMFGSDLTNPTMVHTDVLPRMNLAAIGLFTGLGVLILWYRLPLDTIHKAIIMGIVPYLAIYSVVIRVIRDFGPGYESFANAINTAAWLLVTSFWAWVAWRPRTPKNTAAVNAQWPR